VLGLAIGLGLAFLKYWCDNNAQHKLVHNIGSKFDGGACALCIQKLPTATRDSLLRSKELVGQLAIREATAKEVSRGQGHGAFRYGGPSR